MDRLQAEFDLAFPSFRLDVALDVPAQGVTAVFGPSGCGKTTLLRCLAGLEHAPHGVVRLGRDVWQDGAQGMFVPVHRRAVGYVFQELRLFPHLTVRGNLNYGWHRTTRVNRRLGFDQVVALLDLQGFLDRRPDRLSGGEQQRVAIGRALLTSPRLLLFDEPLSSLDAQRKRDILPFIQRLDAELKIPIVYVSHSLNEILQLTKTLVLMQEGQILAAGPIGEVLARMDLRRSLGQHMVGAVLDTRVIGHDPDYGLTHLEFPGGRLSVPSHFRPVGSPVRVHILSRDVSLVVGEPPARTSILNIFPGTISDIGAPGDDGQMVEVKVDIGSPILASITRKSLVQLGLRPGHPVFVQIKAVALNEDLEE